MSLDFKNNIKNFKTTSLAICRRNMSRTRSWTVFPRIYTNFQSKGCSQFCYQVRRSVISTISCSYMLSFKKWEIITEISDSWKIQNASIFYSEKTTLKTTLSTFYLIFKGPPFQRAAISKGHHFSITKLDILIFCNIRHLEMDFLKVELKRDGFFKNFLTKASWKTQ